MRWTPFALFAAPSVAATLCLGALACDPETVPTATGIDSFGSGGMDDSADDVVDPTTGADDEGPVADDSSSGGDLGPGCGNNVIDGDDVCDGTALAEMTCEGLGFEVGELGCTANCGGYDLSGCGFFECGNGDQEPDEDCDGTVGAATCATVGFDNGTLFCTTQCEYNTDSCGMCGDRELDPAEDCEEGMPLGETCQGLDFDSGTLVCGKDCLFDTAGCQLCGNDVVEGTESCDGAELGAATCASLGLEGGDLACQASCIYDYSGCDLQGEPFGNDGMYIGLSLVPGVLPCDDVSATGTALVLSDDGSAPAPLGFTFPFYQTPYTQVTVASNGVVAFGNALVPGLTNECLPGAAQANILIPFWDDLNPSAAGSVRYQTLGAAGSERFVLQYDVPFYSGNIADLIRFQVMLHAAGNIDICYVDTTSAGDTGNNGAEATSGIKRDNATSIQYSCNTSDLTSGLQLMYIPL